MKTLTCSAALAALVLTGCASQNMPTPFFAKPLQRSFFAPEYGWSLCGGALPIDMDSYGADWTDTQRTDVAAAITYAFAHRCSDLPELIERLGSYDRIVATNSPNANQVGVYSGAPISSRQYPAQSLIVDIPDYTDYRTEGFVGDIDRAITCFMMARPEALPEMCAPD